MGSNLWMVLVFTGANVECKSAVSISGAASTSSPRSPSGSISGLVLLLLRGRREGQTNLWSSFGFDLRLWVPVRARFPVGRFGVSRLVCAGGNGKVRLGPGFGFEYAGFYFGPGF